jgi:Ca-activated chloride channel family protein
VIDFELLHVIRPLWLLALPAVLITWWLVRRRESSRAPGVSVIAPHLREALTVNRQAGQGLRAVDGVAIALVAATLAAAGPTWRQQPSPWFAETAPLVIAIEVSDSMRSNDLQPTRLERARFKVLELLALRTGARTALIAYAGSAHIVVPPSRDIGVLKPFLEGLDPAIMPAPGARAAAVLPLARQLFSDQGAAGTLLFVNDGFDSADVPALAAFAGQPGNPSMAALVLGTEQGGVALLPDGAPALTADGGRIETRVDAQALQRVARQAGVDIVRARADDGELRKLLSTIESNLRQADDPQARWRDEGWWLLWPAALLTLAWFRRGWTMPW